MKHCILTVEALNLLPCWKKEPTPTPDVRGVWDPGVALQHFSTEMGKTQHQPRDVPPSRAYVQVQHDPPQRKGVVCSYCPRYCG